MEKEVINEINVNAAITPQILIEAGVQYGSNLDLLTKSMAKFVYGTTKYDSNNIICIIDLYKTQEKLHQACKLMYEHGIKHWNVLVVGRKEPIRDVVENVSQETRVLSSHHNKIIGFHYLNKKFPAGFFTNFVTYQQQMQKHQKLKQPINNYTKITKVQKKKNMRLAKGMDKYDVIFKGVNNLHNLDDIKLVVVVNPSYEHQCVSEAKKMGIPILGLIDTDSESTLCDYIIPCNDNSPASVFLILNELKNAFLKGAKLNKKQ